MIKFHCTLFTLFLKKNYLLIPFFLFFSCFLIVPIVLIGRYAVTTPNVTDVVESTFVWSFIRSFVLSILTLTIVVALSYPFAWCLKFSGVRQRRVLLALITAPIWSTFLIKVIGLKSVFDLWNGYPNSTYGLIYVLIGLVYLYLPFGILAIYNGVISVQSNLLDSAQDLGSNDWDVFWRVVIPNTKESLLSLLALVILPSFTTVVVGEFLNNNNGQMLLGELLNNYGVHATNSTSSMGRMAILVLITSLFISLTFLLYKVIVMGRNIFQTKQQ